MRKILWGLFIVFVVCAIVYSLRYEIGDMYIKNRVTGELRQSLHDPSSFQVVEFLEIDLSDDKTKVPKGLIMILSGSMDNEIVGGLRIFKIRYRAKNSYGALRLDTAYGVVIFFETGRSYVKVYNADLVDF